MLRGGTFFGFGPPRTLKPAVSLEPLAFPPTLKLQNSALRFSWACFSVSLRSEGWSGRRGSNPRRPAWEAGILPLNYSRLGACLRLEVLRLSLSSRPYF